MAAAIAGGQGAYHANQAKNGVLNSMLAVVIDVAKLGDPADVAATIDATRAHVKSARPAAGCEEVLVPGEPERRYAAERSAQGIEVDDTTWRDIRAAAATLGITEAELEQAVGANRA
jgi:hydroxycarboxylate dehydrogenase B